MKTLTITINKLLDEDEIATIQNNNTVLANGSSSFLTQIDSNDIGIFFDIVHATFEHSITELATPSEVTLTINSNLDVASQNQDPISAQVLRFRIRDFIRSLEGRIITVFASDPSSTSPSEPVFNGYIADVPDEITVYSGTQIRLSCRTLLSQLAELSSNRNWDETIKAYGNIFTTLSGDFINFKQLLETIVQGTLLENSEFIIIDGSLAPIPSTVWACINPSKMRLEVLREILIAYNRIIYQKPNGDIIIQPLFFDDYTNDIYNIDAENNDGNYMDLYGTNNSANTPNRIDAIFGINPIGEYNGNTNIDNANSAVFCSAPFTNDDSSLIVPLPGDDGLQYTDIYKSSVRLYNSGKWVMPLQKPIEIGSVVNDTILANVLIFPYKLSNVWSKPPNVADNFARLYAQLFLAELNATNYNATIVYDGALFDEQPSSLGKVVTINNYSPIDYPQMLVTDTTSSYDTKNGSLLIVRTSPLMSITASWGNV